MYGPRKPHNTENVLQILVESSHIVGMADQKIVARKIKALRKTLNESQAVFGERFGVEQATVSRWEKGELPKRSLWAAIANAAGQTAASFFYDATSGGISPETVRAVVLDLLRLLGEPAPRAQLLADLVVEGSLALQARGTAEPTEANDRLSDALRLLRSADQ